MKALVYHGKNDVRTDTVADPSIIDPKDVILKVTATAICGSDLHILDGFTPTMKSGDILGHEFMGEVIELGSAVTRLKKGDRVVVPFTIACGECFFCQKGLTSVCDRSNPNANIAAKAMGHSPSGLYGYSHMLGGYAGGQAEYVRVVNADFNAYKVPEGLTDEQVLFLTDIFPTGYMGAENADIEPGDTVAVWGCGPVGQFAIRSAWMLGAGRVIAIDNVPERLALAETYGKAETIHFEATDEDDEHGGGNVYEKLMEMTNGRGPDRCIDCVGTEAHTHGALDAVLDNIKQKIKLGTDRAHALRTAIYSCRKAGTVSSPGVYLGLVDKVPMGAFVNKGLTMKSGQTHVHRYLPLLMDKIERGEIDPSGIITHRGGLDDAPELYKTFRDKKDGCIKCVLTPHESHVHRAA